MNIRIFLKLVRGGYDMTPKQIINNVGALDNLELTEDEIEKIEAILRKGN